MQLLKYNYSLGLVQSVFITLPFILSIITRSSRLYLEEVHDFQYTYWALHSAPEWALCSCLLFGQCIIHLLFADSKKRGTRLNKGLIATLIIVFGLLTSASIYVIGIAIAPVLDNIWYTFQQCLFWTGIVLLVFLAREESAEKIEPLG